VIASGWWAVVPTSQTAIENGHRTALIGGRFSVDSVQIFRAGSYAPSSDE